MHQHALLLNVYMLFSSIINWLINLFVYFAAIMTQPLAVNSGNLLCQLSRIILLNRMIALQRKICSMLYKANFIK